MSGALRGGKDVEMIDNGNDHVGSLGGCDDDEDDVLGGYESGEVQVFDGTIEKKKSKAKARAPISSTGSEIGNKKRNTSVSFLSDNDDSFVGGYESDQVVVMAKKRKRSVDSDGPWAPGAKRKRGEEGDTGPRKRSVEEGLFVSEDKSVLEDESIEGLEANDTKARKLEAVRRKIQAGLEAAKMRKGMLKRG